nr:alpha/beta fold hydrolase [Streptomyces boncukensis]
MRLVCLPHAGGAASYYFPVSAALKPSVEVLAVQYPGRQERRSEPLFADVAEAADRIADELKGWTDRPLALFGHSLGATIGFEVALRLERAGVGPRVLFASGRRAPARTRNDGIHSLPDSGLIAEMKRMGGTDAAVMDDPDILAMALPAIRSDYRAAETYAYRDGDMLSCPVYALVGDGDARASLEDVKAWGEHTTGSFDFRVFPGGHFYLNGSTEVIALVRDHLAALSG